MFPHVSQALAVTHASRRSQTVAEKAVALAGGGRARANSDPQTQTSSTFQALLHPLVSFSLPVEQRRARTVRCGCALTGALSQEEAYFSLQKKKQTLVISVGL